MPIFLQQPSFARGEISPRLWARADIPHYSVALKECVNWTVMRQGGLRRRSGTRFIAATKDSSKRSRLVPFVFSTEQAYMLEFGDEYVRIYANGGQVESGGSPVEVATPYTEDQVRDVQFAQSADTLYIAHPLHPPAKLTRTSDTSWSYDVISFTDEPDDWDTDDYPGAVSFYEERLCWARTNSKPQTIWMSKAGILEDFGTSSPAEADDAITLTILSGRVDAIQWIAEGTADLIIGTSGAMRTLGPSERGDIFSATNFAQRQQSQYGAARVQPIQVGNALLFADFYGQAVREFTYSWENDAFVSPDATILSEHILQPGVIEMAWQQAPDAVAWMALKDGRLAAMTFEREQDMVSVYRHQIGGVDGDRDYGSVESVATIPGVDRDEVWMIVKRTIDGGTKRYVEQLQKPFEYQDIVDAFFVDSGLSYNGSPINAVSGLDHLEGEEVAILADGANVVPQTVTGGQITLPDELEASVIHAGLAFESRARTLSSPVSMGDGTGLGREKRVTKTLIDLFEAGAMKVGTGRRQEEVILRDVSDHMDAPVPLVSRIEEVRHDSRWKTDGGEVVFRVERPVPATVRAITPAMTLGG